MKMSKNSFFFLALLLAFSVFIAACANEPDATPAPAEGEEAAEGAEGTTEGGEGGDLVIANLSDAVALDPHGSNDTPSSNVAQNIYEALVEQDEDMELQPGLAESWEMVDDLTWEFYLREGVKFHDGSDFNADVVKANLDRILDPEVASPRQFIFNMITDVEVVDEHTVRISTEFPFAPLPAHLAHNGGGMISGDLIAEDYEAMEAGAEPGSKISENPVGTGYFKFDSWTPGTEIKLVRNEDYWGENAKLDSVTFKVVPEDLTRIAELETGAAHISDPLSPSDISRVEGTDGIHVNRQPSVSLSYIGFNVEKEPFDNPLVRQAISKAINKEAIIEGIYDGAGIPAIGPLAPDVFGYDETVSGLEYNVEEAQALLAEAGYEDGFSTTIWTNDNRERIDAATFVQAELEKIGIDVSIEVVEWGAYLENTANGEHDMFVLGWSTVTGDADYGMYALFHSDNHGEPGNRTFLSNPELDELLDQARQNPDPDERAALYKDAQEILVEEAPMLYIHHQQFLLGVSDNVQGLWQHPTGILMLQDVTLQ
ncbi:glutathione ABC transporter substrate-binding protein [Halalkalibacter alkaliphilus]|uniref:Glutathione ABC transporter substrate-binding protein n=1 Tax=Halalkalibacter alkaliphilus TaxID=2917993 RepID=A0A9X2CX48_9BACI|nr:glutathione ABC transporter substrate-binding protein [Halalkalibacter alkaliphilus]MCL7749881.1 glutathione ABC transporter substrate-binding protein [Halalkalibacter alkaliphilus]